MGTCFGRLFACHCCHPGFKLLALSFLIKSFKKRNSFHIEGANSLSGLIGFVIIAEGAHLTFLHRMCNSFIDEFAFLFILFTVINMVSEFSVI